MVRAFEPLQVFPPGALERPSGEQAEPEVYRVSGVCRASVPGFVQPVLSRPAVASVAQRVVLPGFVHPALSRQAVASVMQRVVVPAFVRPVLPRPGVASVG